jgi:hypothetical protein
MFYLPGTAKTQLNCIIALSACESADSAGHTTTPGQAALAAGATPRDNQLLSAASLGAADTAAVVHGENSRVLAEQAQPGSDKPVCFSDRAHEQYLDGIWSPMREVPKPNSYQCTNELWRVLTSVLTEEDGTPEMFCGAGSAQRKTALPLEYTATSCTLPSLDVTDLLQLVRVRPAACVVRL